MVATMVRSHNGVADACGAMQRISASQFKARCLGLMDEVARSGEVLVITKNGNPVAELHPCRPARRASPFGLHPDTQLLGEVIAPLDESWKALQ
jgi:prevent-host-death family protein